VIRRKQQAEPTEAFAFSARKDEPRFAEIEEMFSVMLRFPNERLAAFTISYGADAIDEYRVVGTKGNLEVKPGFNFREPLRHRLTVQQKETEKSFPKVDQFGAETKYFSDCILNNRDPEPDGEEGLADVRVLLAIEQSLTTGKPHKVNPGLERRVRPSREQIIRLPAVTEKKLVDAADPGGQ
jgi:predicted dehydrogenase